MTTPEQLAETVREITDEFTYQSVNGSTRAAMALEKALAALEEMRQRAEAAEREAKTLREALNLALMHQKVIIVGS